MSVLLFLVSIVLPAAVGYVVICGGSGLGRAEKIIYSYLVGAAFLTFYLFILGMAGIPFSGLTIGPFFVLAGVGALFRRDRLVAALRTDSVPERRRLSPRKRILFGVVSLLLLLKIAYLVFMVSSVPTLFWDAYTLWNLKAKQIYMSGGSGFFTGSFDYYPLGQPIIRAWSALVGGGWEPLFANGHGVLLYCLLIGLVYCHLRRERGSLQAVLFAYLLAAVPVLINNAMSGYADIAVSCYYLAAVVALEHWRKGNQAVMLVVSGLMSAMAMFTKNEGIAIAFPGLVAAFAAILLRSGRSMKQIAAAGGLFAGSLAIILFWLISSDALTTIVEISGVKKGIFVIRPEGIKPFLEHLFVFGNYNIFWFGMIVLFAVRRKRLLNNDTLSFLIPAVVSFIIIIYVFLFTKNVAWLVNGTTINRSLLIVVPLIAVSAGLVAYDDRCDGSSERLK